MTGFVTGDVTPAGTAGATNAIVTEITPNDGTTYNVAVSGMTNDGTVIATISAGVAMDTGANGNAASTSTDNTVTYDTTTPETSITAQPSDPSNDPTPTFSFTGDDTGGSGIASFECQLDGGGYADCTSGDTFGPLADGPHTFDVRATGPLDQLALSLDVQTEAGAAKGDVTADLKGPEYAVSGDLAVNRLNLAPILRDPGQRSDITGNLDLNIRGQSLGDPTALSGSVEFDVPRVATAAVTATDLKGTASIEGRRVDLNARGLAYGASATTSGTILLPDAQNETVAFDLQGRARVLLLSRAAGA